MDVHTLRFHESGIQNSNCMWRANSLCSVLSRVQWQRAFCRVHWNHWRCQGNAPGRYGTHASLERFLEHCVSECLGWTCSLASEIKCWFPSMLHSLVWLISGFLLGVGTLFQIKPVVFFFYLKTEQAVSGMPLFCCVQCSPVPVARLQELKGHSWEVILCECVGTYHGTVCKS